MEYTDYQLPLTDIEIANALKLINNMERGTVTLTVTNNTGSVINKTVAFKKSHKNPIIFLQTNVGNTSNVNPYRGIVLLTSGVTTTSMVVSMLTSYMHENGKPIDLRAGTYKINYLIIDG